MAILSLQAGEILMKKRKHLSLALDLTENKTHSHVSLQKYLQIVCFFSHLASPITPSALALQRRVTVGLSSFPSSLPSPPQTSPLIIGGHWSRQSNKDPVCETAASQRVCDTRVTQRRWDREEGARETGGGGGRRESYKTPKITTIQQTWALNHTLNVKAKCKKKVENHRAVNTIWNKITLQVSVPLKMSILPTVLPQAESGELPPAPVWAWFIDTWPKLNYSMLSRWLA